MEPRKEPAGRAGRGCARPELAARLVAWDELDAAAQRELFEHAAACPSCGPQLALLRRAQAWLEPTAAASDCPSADELYDFGRGPGARALADAARTRISAHLAGCADCTALVATLASRPPVPLIDEGVIELAPAKPKLVVPRRSFGALAWVSLAAAAALLFVLFRPQAADSHERGATAIRFPTQPVLRGAADDALLFPRDRVLRGEHGLFAPLSFELAPRERATSYRVDLFEHHGGAFDSGARIATASAPAPTLAAPSDLDAKLVAGHYTWEAWAVIDGLDVHLGRRDFEVVVDPALIGEIDARRAALEPARSESILHLLHDAGFVGDARAFARTLPATPERDAYLARLPGR